MRTAHLMLAVVVAACQACGPRDARPLGDASPAQADVRYHVTVDGELSKARVRACFDRRPRRLVPGVRRAGRFLARAWVEPGGKPLEPEGSEGTLSLGALSDGDCVGYVIDLARLADEGTGRHDTWAGAGALVLNPDLLFWRPGRVPRGYAGTVTFELSPGHAVSSPWPALPTGEHLMDRQAFQGTSRLVVGEFAPLVVQAAGGRIDVAVLDAPPGCTPEGIRAWLGASLQATALVYGESPVPRIQAIVVPTASSRDRPVVFGMALRGGGAGLVLLLASDATDAALPGEWIAIHEIFHLGMPAIARDDVWLSEGVTMYYSETLRGRAGYLEPREVWQRLEEGFQRGRRGGTGRTLGAESEAMHETSAYMRVYWGGAAMALAWDVALRQASGGRRSLDDALRHLRSCCLAPPRTWTADEVVAELDAWWGEPIFSSIARPLLSSKGFPDQGPLYQRLGLEVVGGRIAPRPGAPDAALRDAIVGGGPAATLEPPAPPSGR